MARKSRLSAPRGKRSQRKIHRVMSEFKRGALRSGSKRGPRVKSRRQAVAIAMDEARRGR